MNSTMRRLLFLLGAVSLLATQPATAQTPPFKSDGKPDPTYDVPPELTLNYALAFALDNSFAIRQAQERIRQQDGVIVEVQSARTPTVSAAANYQRNDEELSGSGEDRNWGVSITARQIVYAGGGVSASIRNQQLAREAAVLALQSVIDDTLLQVRSQFYTVLVNRERIKVQEQNVELLQRQLQDVKNRFDAGTVSNFEVLRAEVALANAKTPLITARNDYRLAIEQLRQALGFTTATTPNVTKIPEFVGQLEFKPIAYDLTSALTTARAKRPDLLRLQKLEQAAEQGVLARRANYRPVVSLFGSYAAVKRTGSNSFGDARDGLTVGVQSSWDIFDGRATAGQVMQARSQLEQIRLAYGESQLTVDVDVRRAISNVQQSTELSETSAKVVAQAEESVRLANARYAAGTATQLDVFQAQVDLTTARLNQVQAYYSFNIAAAQLRRAMGLSDELAGRL
jgi:outer membrane protein